MVNKSDSFQQELSSCAASMSHPPVTNHFRRLSRTYGGFLPLFALGSMLLFLLLCLLLLTFAGSRLKQEHLAHAISPQILRIHVIANSDSEEDQTVKMEVKTALLSFLEKDLETNENGSADKQTILSYLQTHQKKLEQCTEQILRARGFSYPVSIQLGPHYFSTRAYEKTAFPCGVYDSVRVLLGEARGHNWWGILYPPLAFPGSVVPEENAKNQSAASVSDALIFDKDIHWMSQKKHIFFDMGERESSLHSSALSPADGSTLPGDSKTSSSSKPSHSSDNAVTLRVTCRFLSFLP